MGANRKDQLEQRLIDHEVRLSEARETGYRYTAARELRRERGSREADRRWYRGELVAMLTAARTERELHGLGLSDQVVREARLGDSLLEAWMRFHPQPYHPAAPATDRAERADQART
ncbi:MAG: hypothetical protein KY467_05295 [Gemmatimonadetes bacterium]|nr:hypothetical protein [Gemmatimonadota bacterium]